MTAPPGESPDFGPSGYLAPRAAKRARKIVLRERMGLGWPLAAVLAGVVIAVVAPVFFLRTGPPGPPFVAVISIIDIAPGTAELGGKTYWWSGRQEGCAPSAPPACRSGGADAIAAWSRLVPFGPSMEP